MKIFLDTNVVLDWIMDRQDTFADEATAIVEAAEKGRIEAHISAGSIYTMAYVLEKGGKKGEELRKTLYNALEILKVRKADDVPYRKACLRNMKDLEDAFQYEVALHGTKLNFFITGNLRDFATTNTDLLPVITPAQMIAFL